MLEILNRINLYVVKVWILLVLQCSCFDIYYTELHSKYESEMPFLSKK